MQKIIPKTTTIAFKTLHHNDKTLFHNSTRWRKNYTIITLLLMACNKCKQDKIQTNKSNQNINVQLQQLGKLHWEHRRDRNIYFLISYQ